MNSDLLARADAAASRGQMYEALKLLQQAIDSGGADFDTLLKAASLYRANSEPRKALAAIDQALALEPLHFLALFMRAWLLDELASPDAAKAYGAALAQRGTTAIPPAMEQAVKHAQELYDRFVLTSYEDMATAMDDVFDRASDLEKLRLRRFASNTARVTRPYHCEPTYFHFPGLAEYEFHDRSFFPWIEEIEAATDEIREELRAVMVAEGAELVPYVQYTDQVPMRQWKPLNDNLDWTAIHLLYQGERVEANARLCPRTMELLARTTQPMLEGNAPNAMFSLLKPNVTIPPHFGVANFRLVCHLPLIVPGDCWFRVGATRREWKEGELFVFDDSIEHEAANESEDLRVVLIFDTWHPGLSEVEKEGIAAALKSTPGFSGNL